MITFYWLCIPGSATSAADKIMIFLKITFAVMLYVCQRIEKTALVDAISLIDKDQKDQDLSILAESSSIKCNTLLYGNPALSAVRTRKYS